MTLYELTNQESGIIISTTGDVYVANWMSANDDYFPMLSPFGNDLIDFPIAKGSIEAAEKTERYVIDIREELPYRGTVVYDYNSDIPALIESEEPTGGTVYTLENGTKIIAPDGWI